MQPRTAENLITQFLQSESGQKAIEKTGLTLEVCLATLLADNELSKEESIKKYKEKPGMAQFIFF
jgi:hypothetical protein